MRAYRSQLKEHDREAILLAKEFLRKRLQERATIDWALALKPDDTEKRMAIVELVTTPGVLRREPWRSAWRLLAESWEQSNREPHDVESIHALANRLKEGDRSSSWIAAILEHVRPRLEVKEFDSIHRHFLPAPKQPTKAGHLFQIELSRGPLVDLSLLNLPKSDARFLRSLARALDSAVLAGIELALSIGWDGEIGLSQLRQVMNSPDDPDQFSQGLVGSLAPSVKLLHVVVSRLVDVNPKFAIEFVRRWRATDTSIHLRLWSSLSCDPRVTPSSEVGDALLSLTHARFWDDYTYPEIAKLRATRFKDLDRGGQGRLLRRILRLPPRSLFRQPDEIEKRRIYGAALALQRITKGGGVLSDTASSWLRERRQEFPDLMAADEESHRRRRRAFVPPTGPDAKYDLLQGAPRLKALEIALTASTGTGRGAAQEGAEAWIRRPDKALVLLDDLCAEVSEKTPYSGVLSWFYWFHSTGEGGDPSTRDLPGECQRVLSISTKLSDRWLSDLVNDTVYWLWKWREHAFRLPEGFALWSRLWPIAVSKTSSGRSPDEPSDLNDPARDNEPPERVAERVFASPVGKLVEAFVSICPDLRKEKRPFERGRNLRTMRDAVESASGLSGIYARFELVRKLDYFYQADEKWAKRTLVAPLLKDDDHTSLPLWHAVALHSRFFTCHIQVAC